jgi:hypothetical protein
MQLSWASFLMYFTDKRAQEKTDIAEMIFLRYVVGYTLKDKIKTQ